MSRPKTVPVTVKLPRPVARWVTAYAQQTGQSRSAAIRALIERELRATGYPIPQEER